MATKQFDLFVHDFDNNPESQKQLDKNKPDLKSQCQRILELLLRGQQLTVWSMYTIYKIGDPRRRMKDLKDSGVGVSESKTLKGTKTWYMTPEQVQSNQKFNHKN